MQAQSFSHDRDSTTLGSADTVSVVIAVRDGEDTIQRAVRSVLDQRSPANEVIVVDDKSADDTKQRVTELNDGRVMVVEGEGRGVSAARNHGVRVALSGWIAFLDGDDYWDPEFLELARTRIGLNPDAVACFVAGTPVDDDGQVIGRHDMQAVVTLRQLVTGRIVPTTSATLARRDAILRCGGFFEGFKCAAGVEDLDLWWRLATTGRCVGVRKSAATYVVHDQRDGERPTGGLLDLERDREMVIKRLAATDVPTALVRKARAVMRARTARYWLRAAKPAHARAVAWSSLLARPTLEGGATMIVALIPGALRGALVQFRRRLRAAGSFRR